MLIVLEPQSSRDNRDFTATFSAPLEISANAKISLISAFLPLDMDESFDIQTGINDFLQISGNFTGSPRTYTIASGSYTIYQLTEKINEQLRTPPIAGTGGGNVSIFLTFDFTKGVFIFNLVSNTTINSMYINVNLLPNALTQQMGLNEPLSLTGYGSFDFPSPPITFQTLLVERNSINVSLPDFNISNLLTGSGNNYSIIQSIPIISKNIEYPTFYYKGLNRPVGTAVPYYYEPKYKTEIMMNDSSLILTSLRLRLLDDVGQLYENVNITDNVRVRIVLDIETENEKVYEALVAVKDKLRFERFLQNHQYQQPI